MSDTHASNTAPVYIDCRQPTLDAIRRLGLDQRFPQVRIHVGQPQGEALATVIKNANCILTGRSLFDRQTLAMFPQLRRIVYLGTGAEASIDVIAAREQGITVIPIRNYGNRSNAEYAFGLILDAARHISRMHELMREGGWETLEGMELKGKRLGVLGVGGIGSELIRIGAAFGMKVNAWNRSPIDAGLPCTVMNREALLAESDIISLHLGYNPETHHIIDAAAFEKMKNDVILINAARGGLVDENALLQALMSGKVAHASLDVFDDEPLSVNHRLRQIPNVTLSCHAAFNTTEALERLVTCGFEALCAR